MFPDLEFIKTCLNGFRSRIEKIEDWAVSTDQVTQAVADYFVENPIVESDPTVPVWAKEPTKPTYTTAEIGAQPDMYVAYFSELIVQLMEKPVVYVANADSTSPIPSGRYPVLLMRSGIDRGMADVVAYDAAGKTWAGSVNFVHGTIGLVERTLTASDIDSIPVPATASVGQVIAVKAVDADGKPTEWEAVDMISGERDWVEIASGTVGENVTMFEFTGLENYNELLFTGEFGVSSAQSGAFVSLDGRQCFSSINNTYFVHSSQNKQVAILMKYLTRRRLAFCKGSTVLNYPYNQDWNAATIITLPDSVVGDRANTLKIALSASGVVVPSGSTYALYGRS